MTAIAFQQSAPGVATGNLAATSANTALGAVYKGVCFRVVNPNTVVAFVRFGIGSQTATTADTPVAAGASADIYVGAADNVAVIGQAVGTLPVYLCPGS